MHYQRTTTSSAEPDRLWTVVTDVDRWPEWIEVYETVERAPSGPLAVGDTAHVKQRGLAAGDWTVTEMEEGRVFAWESRQPGVRFVGRHAVEPGDDGGSRLVLSFEMTGVLAGLVSLLYGRKARAYVDLEGQRLAAVAAQPA
jgi:ribosome-associated toxin RatA of RatAB toxin-antitoxin module